MCLLLFAGELQLCWENRSLKDARVLQQDLVSLSAWPVDNSLLINVGKCLVMPIGKEAPGAIYTTGGNPLTVADTFM